jgi:hypothetical protein
MLHTILSWISPTVVAIIALAFFLQLFVFEKGSLWHRRTGHVPWVGIIIAIIANVAEVTLFKFGISWNAKSLYLHYTIGGCALLLCYLASFTGTKLYIKSSRNPKLHGIIGWSALIAIIAAFAIPFTLTYLE